MWWRQEMGWSDKWAWDREQYRKKWWRKTGQSKWAKWKLGLISFGIGERTVWLLWNWTLLLFLQSSSLFTKGQLHYKDLLNSHNSKQIQGSEPIQFSTMWGTDKLSPKSIQLSNQNYIPNFSGLKWGQCQP